MLNRREFSKYFVAGGAALLAPRGIWSGGSSSSPQQSTAPTFDLLIEGGTVVDPSQNLHGAMDVAIKDGKIAQVSKNIGIESSRPASSMFTRTYLKAWASGQMPITIA